MHPTQLICASADMPCARHCVCCGVLVLCVQACLPHVPPWWPCRRAVCVIHVPAKPCRQAVEGGPQVCVPSEHQPTHPPVLWGCGGPAANNPCGPGPVLLEAQCLAVLPGVCAVSVGDAVPVCCPACVRVHHAHAKPAVHPSGARWRLKATVEGCACAHEQCLVRGLISHLVQLYIHSDECTGMLA